MEVEPVKNQQIAVDRVEGGFPNKKKKPNLLEEDQEEGRVKVSAVLRLFISTGRRADGRNRYTGPRRIKWVDATKHRITYHHAPKVDSQ